ncbi:CPBP family glutamic-type intramembrane protease [Variovorax sp. J22P271]|uniref:CPBP family glutamic-type intramembrane protease n=1 Tax=Variovorax davisae TaxID=3053515 RepID=UPI0025754B32|nr:CPBP family glutamic-type intramembrane protease [Variovorax sp. J22P271]MDM0032216.1 CPBP family glutamic-type intramembrane protease [Variovorax sp. J22P271]
MVPFQPMQDPLSRWLRRRSAATFVVLLVAANYVVAVLGYLLFPAMQPAGPIFEVHHLGLGLLLTVLVIPVIETAVFQWVPIRKLGLPCRWGILLSATLFGLSHWYSLSDVVATFLIGLVFAYGFAVRDPENGGKPFLLVTIAHALHNSVAAFLA